MMKFLIFSACVTLALAQQLLAEPYGLTDNDIEEQGFKIEHQSSYDNGQEKRKSKTTFVNYLKTIKDHHTEYEQGKNIIYNNLKQWELFKIEYKREYKNKQEERKRRTIFLDNLKTIHDHNAKYERGETTFYMGVNQLTDMTIKEVQETMSGLRIPENYKRTGRKFKFSDNIDLPETVDWRKSGAVTPVKNQGRCGSCWAFSATGSLEGQTFLKTGQLVSLSEQNLVDCSSAQGNLGCDGGTMDGAFNYVRWNSGIDTEASYPYEATEGLCRYTEEYKGATVSGIVDIESGNENSLQAAVAQAGPVSVGIDANHTSFSNYKGGIYKEHACSTTEMNHGVLVVGYGETEEGAYWLVKNSWGENWGMGGYMLMPRNKNNMCGIATMASFPLV